MAIPLHKHFNRPTSTTRHLQNQERELGQGEGAGDRDQEEGGQEAEASREEFNFKAGKEAEEEACSFG